MGEFSVETHLSAVGQSPAQQTLGSLPPESLLPLEIWNVPEEGCGLSWFT